MRTLYYLIVVGIYTAGYLFLVFATLADGHGTGLFAVTLIPWLLFSAAFLAIPYTEKRLVFWLVLALMFIFYASSIAGMVIEQTGKGNFARTGLLMERNPLLFALTTVWYLLGQVLFWILLRRERRRIRPIE